MTYRKNLLLIALIGACCGAGSFFAQYVLLLNPCPLCILQRIAVLSVTLAAVIAALLPSKRLLWRLYSAVLVSIPAVWGWGVAAYQIWLQSLPEMERPSCGAPWSFRLRDWPLFDFWEPVIRGFGDCGTREYVLGVPLPVWSIAFFSVVLLLVWRMWWETRKS